MLNELLALDAPGCSAAVFATKPGDGSPLPARSGAARDRVRVLPPGTADEQARRRRRTRSRARAVHGRPRLLRPPPGRGRGATAAGLLGVPYGFSVHALDARKVDARRARRRARAAPRASSPATPTSRGEVRDAGAAPTLVPHGVDLDRFRPAPPTPAGRSALLAVGRLVQKKGFDVLVDARWRASPRRRACGSSATAPSAHALATASAAPASATASSSRGRAHARRAARRVRAPRTSSSSRRSSTPTATATACRTSCWRRWRAAAPVVASDVAAIASRGARRRDRAARAAGRRRRRSPPRSTRLAARPRRCRARLGRDGRRRAPSASYDLRHGASHALVAAPGGAYG